MGGKEILCTDNEDAIVLRKNDFSLNKNFVNHYIFLQVSETNATL